MSRLRRVRSIGVPLVTTFVAGVLLGVLAVSAFEPAVSSISILSGPRESPSARSLMVGFMEGDSRARGYVLNHINKDGPQWTLFETRDATGTRAVELKLVELAQLTLSPVSLTHLGAGNTGPYGTDLYVLQLKDEKDALVLQPLTVYSIEGRVVDVR